MCDPCHLQMVNGRDDDPKIRSYLDNIVVYIFPVLNPDGYEYTRSDKTNPRVSFRRSKPVTPLCFCLQNRLCCIIFIRTLLSECRQAMHSPYTNCTSPPSAYSCFIQARMWRKSRSAKACAFDGISNACCQGVDLNRNFDFRFAGGFAVEASSSPVFVNTVLSPSRRLVVWRYLSTTMAKNLH